MVCSSLYYQFDACVFMLRIIEGNMVQAIG
jgi:hypothetical protein